jgi:DDE family transposase
MAHSTRGCFARHVDSFRRAFALSADLPLADLLPASRLAPFASAGPEEPVFPPLVTLRLFLGQVLSPDPSCAHAVTKLVAWRAATGQPPVAATTGGYCKARQRLGEQALHDLVRQTGGDLHRRAAAGWLWLGRRVVVADGSTVVLPDTKANQNAYPQPDGQEPGLGFPMARLVVLLCLATGAALDCAVAPYSGKGTGELSLFRSLWGALAPGEVLLADRAYCSYFEVALLARRGVDVVLRRHQSRRTDFRTGRRLGPLDHEVVWKKPKRPDWLDEEAYRELPAQLRLREAAVRVKGRGREGRLVLVTTLGGANAYPRQALGELYRQRWQGEVDLRSIKQATQMERLRCSTPAMARKEVWAHLAAYNLVRGLMAQAAAAGEVAPRRVSFKGAARGLTEFGAGLLLGALPGTAETNRRLLRAVGSQRVGDRPNRAEPRAIKRRKRDYPLLTQPRDVARRKLRPANTT